ncbi:MLO protein homolog 1-like [Ricinus communis]|uniref:MLO protein homolog 1-like n=1 Tax=Ricinus communis TaxID=3988 RepID=UPI00201A6116|nr:MLO protein homolog 1-like [Ricinus communis]
MSMSSITLLSGFKSAKAMAEALICAELMLLGFISLLITVGTKPISMICIPEKAANIMLPCKEYDKDDDSEKDKDKDKGDDRRKLLWYAGDAM